MRSPVRAGDNKLGHQLLAVRGDTLRVSSVGSTQWVDALYATRDEYVNEFYAWLELLCVHFDC